MTPEHVLQEREDNRRSYARPYTPEEDADDLAMMEALYQEGLKASKAPATLDPAQPAAANISMAPLDSGIAAATVQPSEPIGGISGGTSTFAPNKT